MNNGTINISSRWPITGIKSGIKSIGEIAYAIPAPRKNFEIRGVLGLLNNNL